MDVRRKTRVKRDWSVIFEEYHRSGLSIKEFCRAEGMSQSLFYRHRKDYRDADKSARLPLRRSDFIELKRTSPSLTRPSAAIVFGSQIELSICNDCDKELLINTKTFMQIPSFKFLFNYKCGDALIS